MKIFAVSVFVLAVTMLSCDGSKQKTEVQQQETLVVRRPPEVKFSPEAIMQRLEQFEKEQPPHAQGYEGLEKWNQEFHQFFGKIGWPIFEREGLEARVQQEFKRRQYEMEKALGAELTAYLLGGGKAIVSVMSVDFKLPKYYRHLAKPLYFTRTVVSDSTAARLLKQGFLPKEQALKVLKETITHRPRYIEPGYPFPASPYCVEVEEKSVLENFRSDKSREYEEGLRMMIYETAIFKLTKMEIVSLGLTPKEADLILRKSERGQR